MISPQKQKLALQIIVAVGCVVPLVTGLSGVLSGAAFLDESVTNINLDNHFRYLSGLLLAIGIGFLSCIADVENKTARVQLLSFIVVTGGLGRLAGFFISGMPGTLMKLALVMELVIVPLLCIWQQKLSKKLK